MCIFRYLCAQEDFLKENVQISELELEVVRKQAAFI